MQRVLTVLLALCASSAYGFRTNLTVFENCNEIPEVEIELLSVRLDCGPDRVCSAVDGVYEIYKKRMKQDYELWIYIDNCATASVGPCRDNERKYVEPMKCDRFHDDASGPWYMISQAVEHERCGEVQGRFNLTQATLKPEYLEGFITPDATMARYRIKLLFHKKGAPELEEMRHVRGCIDMEFELIF